MNKQEQRKFDDALISMPSCLTSSAYHNNPYYHDYQTIIAFGKETVMAYKKSTTINHDSFITNDIDCRLVEEWLRKLSEKYPG